MRDGSPTLNLAPIAGSTLTAGPYVPKVIGGTGALPTTPTHDYVPSSKCTPLDRLAETQAILAEMTLTQ